MVRPDFGDIFDYITRKSVTYRLNTNGTLITPRTARLLARKGRKMVALYGATAEVHDRVTRCAGSFAATMRGIAYLKEARAGFMIQIVPLRENFHQYREMLALAESHSPYSRVGAPWLWLSASGSPSRNREIASQRLDPVDVVALDSPVPAGEVSGSATAVGSEDSLQCGCDQPIDDRLFARCIAGRRDFHVDPYGQMSFCCFVKDPALRYDLRHGTVLQGWNEFIPSLADKVRGGPEYARDCGGCSVRSECRWCAVYGRLEHGRYSARVEYLCNVAREQERFKSQWQSEHCHYYRLGGVTVKVASQVPIGDGFYSTALAPFRVSLPGDDPVVIRLATPVPPVSDLVQGGALYQESPWAVFRRRDSWAYLATSPAGGFEDTSALALLSDDHSYATVYRSAEAFAGQTHTALSTLTTDQILLARVLADRQGCFVHASGIIVDGRGLLFVGHSGAGKSMMMKLLRGHGEILCDDRIIVRRWPEGFRIHGTWSHGELPDVSPNDAPLHAIFFLEKAEVNEALPITSTRERLAGILGHVVKPLVTADWWEKTLDLAGKLAAEVPAYRLRFDLSGDVVDVVKAV